LPATILEKEAEAAFALNAPIEGSELKDGLAKSTFPPPFVSIKYAPLLIEKLILSSSPFAPCERFSLSGKGVIY